VLNTLPDIAFEVLACLSPCNLASVDDIVSDLNLDTDGLVDALAGISCMDIGLIFKDERGYLTEIAIHPDSWERAKLMAEAYLERTYA
jgi:hypothetical protein